MPKPDVLIRRYNDRRLYNTSASGYVKLEDIARMVREGINVKVVDARGRDLTSVILTQIVVEDARDRRTALPLELLRKLVQASDHATHDFVSGYLNDAFELYQKTQGAIRSRLSDAKTAASSPLDFVRRLLPLPTDTETAPSPDAEEIESLRRQVKDLQAQLAARRKPKRRSLKRGGSA